VTLVELLAHQADHLSYFQDAVATEAYLGTARRRPSVRRHARLLDYRMHDGCNARVWVCLRAEAGVRNVVLPREYLPGRPTRFLTRVPGAGALLSEERFEEIVGERRPAVFEPLHDLRLFDTHNRMVFHAWGDEECCLPAGTTRATLQDGTAPGERLLLRAGDVLVLEEVLGPETGIAADADPPIATRCASPGWSRRRRWMPTGSGPPARCAGTSSWTSRWWRSSGGRRTRSPSRCASPPGWWRRGSPDWWRRCRWPGGTWCWRTTAGRWRRRRCRTPPGAGSTAPG
jgi:hypothetical protein